MFNFFLNVMIVLENPSVVSLELKGSQQEEALLINSTLKPVWLSYTGFFKYKYTHIDT